MNAIDALLTILWTVGVYGLIFYILWWGFGRLGLGEPFARIGLLVLVAVTVIVAIGIITGRVPMLQFCQIGTVNACR